MSNFNQTFQNVGKGMMPSNAKGYSYLTLVFPKAFEMKSFLRSLREGDAFIYDRASIKDIIMAIIKMKIGDKFYKFTAYAIEDSDTNFSFKFASLINDLKTRVDPSFEHMIILCGTCGGSTKSKLTECVIVSQARKFDRGDMWKEDDGALTVKCNKFSESAAQWVTTSPVEKTLCCNYVCHFDPSSIFPEYNFIDMESHEFFKVCASENIHSFVCLRIVSDIFYPEMDIKLVRTIRKRLRFDSLVEKLYDLLSEKAFRLVNCEPPSLIDCTQRNHFDTSIMLEMDRQYPMNDVGKFEIALKSLHANIGILHNHNQTPLKAFTPDRILGKRNHEVFNVTTENDDENCL